MPILDPRQFSMETAEASHELLQSGDGQGRLIIEI
jgi:hypothetical protein